MQDFATSPKSRSEVEITSAACNMAEVGKKLKWLHAIVVDQWKSGKSAELRLSCGNGQLKVSMCADFDVCPAVPSWNAGTDGAPCDASGSGSPSRLRRKLRRAAQRAAAEKAEQSAAEKAVAEMAAAEKAATEKKAAEMAAAEKAVAEKATNSDHVASISRAVPVVFTPLKNKESQVLEIAETAAVEEVDTAQSCRNCEGNFTPGHQCGDSAAPPITSSKGAAIVIGKELPSPAPLPLCHYCCHKGSGLHQVHYYVQCLCSDQVCSCQCYCDEQQLEHKKVFFPNGFSGINCVEPKDRQKAMSIAEARANKPDYRGVPMAFRPCEDENCVVDHLQSESYK